MNSTEGLFSISEAFFQTLAGQFQEEGKGISSPSIPILDTTKEMQVRSLSKLEALEALYSPGGSNSASIAWRLR